MVGGGIRTGVTDQAADRALRLNRHILDGAVCKRDLGIDRAVVRFVIAGCPADQTADARVAGADNFAVLQMAVIQFDSRHGIHAVDKCADSQIIRCLVDIRTSNGQILDHNAGFARKAARKQGGAQAGDGLAVAVQGDDALTMVSIHTHRRPVLTGHIDVVQQLDHGVAGFVCGRKGVGEGGVIRIANLCFAFGFQRKNIVLCALPRKRIGEFDLIAAAVLHRRAGGQGCCSFGNRVERGGAFRLGVVIRHKMELVFIRVSAEIQTNILDAGIARLCCDIKCVAGRSNSARDVPLRNVLKLHRAGAGDGVAGEVDGGQRLEVVTLPLVVVLLPVAVGGTDPRRVGVVRRIRVFVIIERAAVEGQRLRGDRADDDAVEGAAVELQLAQLAPRAGVELVVEAHDVIERGALKGHVGVGGDSQQQGRTDVVDVVVASHIAGDLAADKDDVLAVRAVVLLAQIAVGVVAVQDVAILDLPRRVVSLTVAEYAVLVIAVVADGDVHGALETLLRLDVLITGHHAQLFEGVGVGRGAFVIRRCRIRTRHGRAAVERFGRGGRLAVLGDDFFGRGTTLGRALCPLCIRRGDYAQEHGQRQQQRQELACYVFHSFPPIRFLG